MDQKMLEYRKKNTALIRQGLELWSRAGMELSEEKKERILNEWAESGYYFNPGIDMLMYCKDHFENISGGHADKLLSDIKAVVAGSPFQLHYREERLIGDLLNIFWIIIGSRRLLRDRVVVEWLNRLNYSDKLEFLISAESRLNTIDDVISIIEDIPDDYPMCKIQILSAAAYHYNEDHNKLKSFFKRSFSKNIDFFKTFPRIDAWRSYRSFLEIIDDVEILVHMANSHENAADIFIAFSDRCRKNPKLLEEWRYFIPVFKKHPDALMGINYNSYFIGEPVLQLIALNGNEKSITFIRDCYFHLLIADYDRYIEKIGEWVERHPAVARKSLINDRYMDWLLDRDYDMDIPKRLLTSGIDELITPTLDSIAYNYDYIDKNDEFYDDDYESDAAEMEMKRQLGRHIRDIVKETPELLTRLTLKWTPVYLRAASMDADRFAAVSDIIKPLSVRSKGVRTEIHQFILSDKVPIEVLIEKGWLEDKKKAVRDLTLNALLECGSSNKALLERALLVKQFTFEQKFAIKKRLQELGYNAPGESDENPMDSGIDEKPGLGALLEKAKTVQIRKKKIFKDLWNDQCSTYLEPLDVHACRWLLASLDGDAAANAIAYTLLSHVPEQGQKDFCCYLTGQWIEAKVDVKYDWIIPFIVKYGDDRLVPRLFDALKNWKKGSNWQRSLRCLKALDQLDSAHSLACVYEVSGKSGYGYTIREAACEIMEKAAKRRKITLMDLVDLLLPDFGMTSEGVALDVGPRTYVVKLMNDLTLRVINSETERVTKSFPKRKTDEDYFKHEQAEKKFKYLKSNIRKVAKQQSERMEEYLILGREWDVGNWKKLFFDHPIFSIIAHGVICGWNRDANYISFRISEDKSLVDADDNEVELDESLPVSLWHPVYTNDAARAASPLHIDDS